jgi:hypothetical protein
MPRSESGRRGALVDVNGFHHFPIPLSDHLHVVTQAGSGTRKTDLARAAVRPSHVLCRNTIRAAKTPLE